MGLFDLIGGAVDRVADTTKKFVRNPVGTTVDVATQPVRDGIEIVEGLTEGELRRRAAVRLSVDVVAGMTTSELVEWYNGD